MTEEQKEQMVQQLYGRATKELNARLNMDSREPPEPTQKSKETEMER